MTQSFVQGNHNEIGSAVASLSAAFSSNNAANNLLVYAVGWVPNGATPNPTFSDTAGNTIVDSGLGVLTSGDAVFKQQIVCVLAAKTGANTFTMSFGSPNPSDSWITIHEYNDSVNTGGWSIDKTAQASGNSTNPDSGATATTTQATEVVFGWTSSEVFTITNGTGFTSRENNSPTISTDSEDKFVTSTGTQDAAFTNATSGQWTAQCVTFFANSAVATIETDTYSPPLRQFPQRWNVLRALTRNSDTNQAPPDTPKHFVPLTWPMLWTPMPLGRTTAQDFSSSAVETNPHWIGHTYPPQWHPEAALRLNPAVDVPFVLIDTPTYSIPRTYPPQWVLNQSLMRGTAQDFSTSAVETNVYFIPRTWPVQWQLQASLMRGTPQDFSSTAPVVTGVHYVTTSRAKLIVQIGVS